MLLKKLAIVYNLKTDGITIVEITRIQVFQSGMTPLQDSLAPLAMWYRDRAYTYNQNGGLVISSNDITFYPDSLATHETGA